MSKNAFYSQSGGVTSVINTTASAVILEAKKVKINKVFAGKNGILGALNEELYDTSVESTSFIQDLKFRPGGVFDPADINRKTLVKIKKNIRESLMYFVLMTLVTFL